MQIFRHDNEREVFWIHKSHIAEDFRTAFQSQDSDDAVKGSAAWQLGCCYATGFGVSKDWKLADKYFKHAFNLNNQIACNFGPMLFNQGSGNDGKAYSATIRRMLSLEVIPSGMVFDPRQNVISIQTTASQLLSESSPQTNEVMGQKYVNDIKNFSKIYPWVPWVQLQAGVSPLIQALQAGNWRAAQALLEWGLPSYATNKTDRNMFHWLFMIDDDVMRFVEESSDVIRKAIEPDTLDQSAFQTIGIHAQWPLRLYGTPLMHAIATGNRNTVVALLKLGADPLAPNRTTDDIRSENLWTALHTAVEYHDADMLKLLSENIGERAEDVNLDLSSALCLATELERIAMHSSNCKENLHRIIKMLQPSIPSKLVGNAEAKISLSTTIESNLSSLVSSLRLDNLHVTEVLLHYNGNLARSQYISNFGERKVSNYPIHHAIQMASRRDDPSALMAVKLILKNDPNGLSRVDDRGLTCLHLAASGLSKHVVSFIAERNPSLLHTRDRQGAFPLHYCESVTILDQLVSLGAVIDVTDKQGRSPIFYAASTGLGEVVDGLCKLGAVLNGPIGEPWNPLHTAILNSRFEVMTCLVAYGAQVDLQDNAGDTPLHVAARRSSRYELQVLLENGANISVRNKLNQYPLHVAAIWNNVAAVEVLAGRTPEHILVDFESGDDVRPGVPLSPLYICAERSYIEAMRIMLLQLKKDDVERKDRHQRSVIHYAAMVKNVPLILYLLEMKVDIDASDENNDTPLLIAARSHFPTSTLEACQALIESGASVTHRNSEGEYAWDIAFANKRIDLLIYLLGHSTIASQYVTVVDVLYTRDEESDSNTAKGGGAKQASDKWRENVAQERRVSYARRCCKDELVQIGVEQSNHKLLSTLKARVQQMEQTLAPSPQYLQGYGEFLTRLQITLDRMKSSPWARLGEPTNKWLTTGWAGKEPEFEYFPNFFAPAVADAIARDRLNLPMIEGDERILNHFRFRGQ